MSEMRPPDGSPRHILDEDRGEDAAEGRGVKFLALLLCLSILSGCYYVTMVPEDPQWKEWPGMPPRKAPQNNGLSK